MISREQKKSFLERIAPHVSKDRHADASGCYNIISLYFDSDDKQIYYETRNNLEFRQKLRLRIYNDTDINGSAFFEVKQKFRNVVNKRRTLLKLADAYAYLEGSKKIDEIESSNSQIMREVDAFKKHYQLKPEAVVSYERQAFEGLDDKDLRITFDSNLTCRHNDLRVEHGSEGQHFIDPDRVILEVKVTHSVPLWLTRIMSDLGFCRHRVSKYCSSIELLSMQNLHELDVDPGFCDNVSTQGSKDGKWKNY